MPLRCTIKYGTLVPPEEVASNCSTTSLEASNWAGGVFTTFNSPGGASPSSNDDGVRKPVSARKNLSSDSLVVTMPTVWLSGTASCLRVHAPLLLRVYS